MGVRIRQKGGKWYVFINHQGERKAKCIGDDKRLALQIQKELEAKLTLGMWGCSRKSLRPSCFGTTPTNGSIPMWRPSVSRHQLG